MFNLVGNLIKRLLTFPQWQFRTLEMTPRAHFCQKNQKSTLEYIHGPLRLFHQQGHVLGVSFEFY